LHRAVEIVRNPNRLDVLYTSPGMIRDGNFPYERRRVPALAEAGTMLAIVIETGGTRDLHICKKPDEPSTKGQPDPCQSKRESFLDRGRTNV